MLTIGEQILKLEYFALERVQLWFYRYLCLLANANPISFISK